MLQTPDNSFVIVWITLILILMVAAVVIFIQLYQRKHREYLIQKNSFQETLLRSQLEIKEQTLRHIAYELHDNLGQVASLIKINLNTLQHDNPETLPQKIEATKELTRQLITDLKSLSVSLNSDRIAQLGLERALEDEVTRLNKTGQFEATLEIEGPVPHLDENTMIIFYRMVQEILNNIIKHSNASRVFMAIAVTENLFTLVIRDNGVGFKLEDKLTSGGSGLLNLRSRAKLIQATFSIQSSPGEGTSIRIELSLQKNVSHPPY